MSKIFAAFYASHNTPKRAKTGEKWLWEPLPKTGLKVSRTKGPVWELPPFVQSDVCPTLELWLCKSSFTIMSTQWNEELSYRGQIPENQVANALRLTLPEHRTLLNIKYRTVYEHKERYDGINEGRRPSDHSHIKSHSSYFSNNEFCL